MTTQTETDGLSEASKTSVASGFDAPVASRADDHLNRWPLARQVYSVAVDGPADWSARIGVYGEWGTGKSSVLKFVESMATADRHLVVWFNPWAFSSKSDLWRAFVMEISSKIEPKEVESSSSGMREWKARLGKSRDWLAGTTKEAPGDIAGGVSVALDALRGLFAFTPSDVAAMRSQLGDKRVIILIDDLDRTSAELVPEILYALKEIMDVPGFSFICGFDPKVVGEVLREKHPGFGDGLKFLEKIIDYPVWLPPPSDEGLKRIAEADAEKYCPFIPSTALHDTIPLLSKNPRSVRQFVRLCALLKTQVERHSDEELNWTVILTSNAIKVRFPMYDHEMLHSLDFYNKIGTNRSFDPVSEGGDDTNEAIKEHLVNWTSFIPSNQTLSEVDIVWMSNALKRISRFMNVWMNESVPGVVNQCLLIENPVFLTQKELHYLINSWSKKDSIGIVSKWIGTHADEHGFMISEVCNILVFKLVEKLKRSLQLADGALTNTERSSNRRLASKVITMIHELILRPAQIHDELANRNWLPVDILLGELVLIADAKNEIHREAWKKLAPTLMRLVTGWDADFNMMLDSVRAIGPHGRRWIEGTGSTAFAKQLNEVIDEKLCTQFLQGLDEAGYIARIRWDDLSTRELCKLMQNPNSRLWIKHEKMLVKVFSKKSITHSVQGNAFAFLEWINHTLKHGNPSERASGEAIGSKKAFIEALWRACNKRPILGRQAHYLRDIPELVAHFGIQLGIPAWWQPAIDGYVKSLQEESTRKAVAAKSAQVSEVSGE